MSHPLTDSHKAEEKHAERQPNVRLEALQNDVARYLENDIASEKDHQANVVLVTMQVQILTQTENLSVCNVCAI